MPGLDDKHRFQLERQLELRQRQVDVAHPLQHVARQRQDKVRFHGQHHRRMKARQGQGDVALQAEIAQRVVDRPLRHLDGYEILQPDNEIVRLREGLLRLLIE